MSQNILNNIIKQVNNNSKMGIAVKSNVNQQWLHKMTTLEEIRNNGYENVECFLNKIYDAGYPDITIYLKRSNGTSSIYVKGQEVRLKNPNNVSSNDTSTLPVESGSVQSLVAIQPKTNAMQQQEQPQNFGMLGGMNMQTMNMYSKATAYDSLKPKYDNLEAENKAIQVQLQDLKLEKLMLERDVKDNGQPKKPIVSDEIASLLLSVAPSLLEKLPAKGLNAPAPQPEETFSETKTSLLNTIKNAAFTDDYCGLFSDIINHLIANPNKVDELINFTKTNTNATNTN